MSKTLKRLKGLNLRLSSLLINSQCLPTLSRRSYQGGLSSSEKRAIMISGWLVLSLWGLSGTSGRAIAWDAQGFTFVAPTGNPTSFLVYRSGHSLPVVSVSGGTLFKCDLSPDEVGRFVRLVEALLPLFQQIDSADF